MFQPFGSAWISLEKKIIWLRAHPLVRRLLHLFVGPETLACHRLFERSKDMKVTGVDVWRVRRKWKTLERQILDCCQQLNGQYGAEDCHVGAKHLHSDVHIFWTGLQDAGDSLGDLHALHWSQCSPWACSAPKLPLVHPKRGSA